MYDSIPVFLYIHSTLIQNKLFFIIAQLFNHINKKALDITHNFIRHTYYNIEGNPQYK